MKKIGKLSILITVAVLTLAIGLFAAACAKKVTLTFETNGGSPVSDVTAEAGAELTLPQTLKSGYAFDGWYSSPDFTGDGLRGEISAPEEDTKYYAKWSKAYAVRLETDGGVFEAGAPELWLAEGANVYEAVKDLRPTKSGLDFGAWFAGDAEIANGYRMPAGELTLTAKYKVGYTVETYLHNLAGNSYVRGENATGTDYVGANVTPAAPTLTGFTRTDTPSGETPVSSLVLKENAEENLFKFYYDRLSYRVIFDANAPSSAVTGSVETITALFGETVTLPENGFVWEGRRFAGWSVFADGEVEYGPYADYVTTGDVVLYAIWDRGYTDRFGGRDLIYFPRLQPDVAILERGGCEFEGTRDGDLFSFTTPAGEVFRGKVYGATFSYERDDLAGEYVYYANTPDPSFPQDELYDLQRTISIDNYLNATYKNGAHTCTGAVEFNDERGDYIFTSDDESFHFLPSTGTQFEYERVFSIGGEEMGGYIDFVMVDPQTGMGYVGNSMVLVLDGYSTAALLDATNYITYDGRYYVEGVYMMGSVEVYKIVCFIADPNGFLTGIEGATATNYIYTVPLNDPDFDGYVSADGFRKEYTDGKGGVLFLDGFGIFADSFVYSANGKTYRGMYSVSTDLLAGSVVTLSAETGESFTFRVDVAKAAFSEPKQLGDGSYTEYRRLDGSSLKPPFLVFYEEDVRVGGEVLGKKAEIWVPSEDGSDLIKAAEGYYTSEPIGKNSRFSLFTFTRTSATEGFENETPEKLVFYNSHVTSTVDYMSYEVYCVLSETVGGEKSDYWELYDVTDGGKILKCVYFETGGLGALLIGADGEVEEGEFEIAQSENFGQTVGSFTYATEAGDLLTRRFFMTYQEDELVATPTEFEETTVYMIQSTGVAAGGVGTEMLFLDGVSKAKYTEDKGATYVNGDYRVVASTPFGETVYAFTVGGEERFRFALYMLPQEEYAGVPLAIKYDFLLENEYGAPDDGRFSFSSGENVLTLDGYHTASLQQDGTTAEGEYFRDLLFQTISFTLSDGTEYLLEINVSAKSFRRIDWAAGRTWQLLDNNFEPINGYFVSLEDKGTEKEVTVKTSGGSVVSAGRYVVLDTVNETWGHEEYLFRNVNFGDGYPEGVYRVTFAVNSNGEGACLVYNPDASGVFTDENWNVLLLDGFGRGEFFTADYSGSGSYEVIDFDTDFLQFTVDDATSSVSGETFYFLMAKNIFYMTDYESLAGVYFSDQMESVAFAADGTFYLGASSGPYYVQNGRVRAYLGSNNALREFDAPRDGIFSDGTKTYRLWDGNELVLSGVVQMRTEDGTQSAERPDLQATLTFTPDGAANSNRPAVFTFAGYDGEDGEPEKYAGYTLRFYASSGDPLASGGGAFSPSVTYGRNSYPIAFAYADGKFTFTVTAGHNKVEYLDHNTRYYPDDSEVTTPRGGRLYKTTFGFGAIVYENATISGDFLYLYEKDDPVYSKPVHFDGVKEEDVKVVGYVPGYGDRLEIVFRASDGKDYALDYYEYYQGGIYFWCYGLFTYQDVQTEEYTVRVKTLQYTKMSIAPGYFDAQNGSGKGLGKISSATLLKKDGDPVVAYDAGITPDGYNNGVWIVDKADAIEHGTTETCTWGTGYLITFTFGSDGATVTAANVEKYRFAQVVNYMDSLVNLFFDENNDVILASVLMYNPEFGRYDFVGDPHDLTENEDGSFTFRATWNGEEQTYHVTVEEGEDVVFEDGEGQEQTMPGYNVAVTVS